MFGKSGGHLTLNKTRHFSAKCFNLKRCLLETEEQITYNHISQKKKLKLQHIAMILFGKNENETKKKFEVKY